MIGEGTTLGAYRLVRRLGAGGMGEVWMAEHAMLGRRAAVKVLHDSYSSRPEIAMRFFNEARAAAAIADPGIVQIYDFGRGDNGMAYLVMEMLDGESLEDRRRKRRLDVAETVRLVRQVAISLGAAHARGIVHRDLKPDNIFVVPDPEAPGGERTKLLDFGIAKLSAEQSGLHTATHAVMGTPMFMSPEQCRGAGGVDARSDIYSLGCVLYLLLTGRAPFEAEGSGDLIIMHVCVPAPPIASLRPDLPVELAALVDRCLAKDAAARPANGAELASLLELRAPLASATSPSTATSSAAMSASWHGDGAVVVPTTLSSAATPVGTQPPAPARRRRWLPIAASAVLALGIGSVLLVRRGGNSSSIAPAAAPPPAAPITEIAPPPHVDAPEPPQPQPQPTEPAPAVVAKPAPKPTNEIANPTYEPKPPPPQTVVKTTKPTPPTPTPTTPTHAAPPPQTAVAKPAATTSPIPQPPPPPTTAPTPPTNDPDFEQRREEQRKKAQKPSKVKPVD